MAIIFSPLPGILYRKPAPDKPAYKSDGDRAFDNPLGAQPAAVSRTSDKDFSSPSAQIPRCAANAPGSSLGFHSRCGLHTRAVTNS
jgi:hypothetical protein